MKRLGQYYCLEASEYEELTSKSLEKEYNELLDLVARILPKEGETGDKRISRKDFVALHNFMVRQMDNVSEDFTEDNNAIYGHNVTVHWHGFYCDCVDGAQPANYIFPAIKELDDELGEEDEQK